MYEYDKETKTLTLNRWAEAKSLPRNIKNEVQHLLYTEKEHAFFSDKVFVEQFQNVAMLHLKDMTICDENPDYKSISGIVYSKDGKKVVFCPIGRTGHVQIQNGTKIISDSAFMNSQISEVTVPVSVETIKKSAFEASNLEYVHFLNDSQLKNVESDAFTECESLRQIAFPDSVTRLDSYILRGSGIEQFEFPPNLTYLGDELFDECAIKEVRIPQKLLKEKGYSYFIARCISLYCPGEIETPAAIVFKSEGRRPIVVPRYIKYGNLVKAQKDIQTYLSQKDTMTPDLYKYGAYSECKEDTAFLQYKLNQTKSSRRSLVLNALKIATRKAKENEESMLDFVALDIWKPDTLQDMLEIAQERKYTSVITYIVTKMPKKKNVRL